MTVFEDGEEYVEQQFADLTLMQDVVTAVTFAETNLTEVNCTHTDFSDSRFIHTNLTKADFCGAHNYAVVADRNTLKKTKFSLPEAVALLHGLDIILAKVRRTFGSASHLGR